MDQELQDSCDQTYCDGCESPLLVGETITCCDCGRVLCRDCFLKGLDHVRCKPADSKFVEDQLKKRQCVRCFRTENQFCSTCAKYITDGGYDEVGHCLDGNPTDDIPDTEIGDCDAWEDDSKWEPRLVPKGFPDEKLETIVIIELVDSEQHYGKVLTTEAFVEKVQQCIKQVQATISNYCTEDLYLALEKAGVPVFDYDVRKENF